MMAAFSRWIMVGQLARGTDGGPAHACPPI
jgi:hypothetical protein